MSSTSKVEIIEIFINYVDIQYMQQKLTDWKSPGATVSVAINREYI